MVPRGTMKAGVTRFAARSFRPFVGPLGTGQGSIGGFRWHRLWGLSLLPAKTPQKTPATGWCYWMCIIVWCQWMICHWLFDGDVTFESIAKGDMRNFCGQTCLALLHCDSYKATRVVLRNLSRLQHGEVKVVAADVARLRVRCVSKWNNQRANHMGLSGNLQFTPFFQWEIMHNQWVDRYLILRHTHRFLVFIAFHFWVN